MKGSGFFSALAVFVSFLIVLPAGAGGLLLYELGTPDLGTAAAGRAAMAADASTAAGNPAGMTRLDRSQMLAAFQGLYVNARFDTDIASFAGGDGGNAGGFVPAGSFHYVHSLTPDWKLGLSAGSYFGLGVDYGDDWAGRYYTTEAELLTLGLNPSVGYRVNNWLAVGGGFNIIYAKLTQKAAINNGAVPGQAGLPDGELKLEDDDVAYGFNLGVLLAPRDDTRFGITYRSEVDLEFKDTAGLKNIGPVLQGILNLSGLAGSKVNIDMTIPQLVMISAYHQLTDQWAVMGNLGWQDWSEFGKQDLTLESTTSTTFTKDLEYDDTWHVALGAQYRFGENWLWSVGAAYDTSPTDEDTRTPDLPLDRQIRVGTGIQYDWTEAVTLGVAYEYLDAGDAKIDQEGGPLQGSLKGQYDTNAIHFFAANLIWKF
ncbi:MAG: outer membrane protein transport protein [Deltaproteobacteria bacterium]|jgi:long-chain fatty acid transport protein|nr:outer membrane protein transport protein [Deltaproteobacteria bacterium]